MGFFPELPEKYNTLINRLCEMGSLDSAVLIMLDEMEKEGDLSFLISWLMLFTRRKGF